MEKEESGCPQEACSLVEDAQGTKRDQRTKEETRGTLWWITATSGYKEGRKLYLKMQVSKHLPLADFENGCHELSHYYHPYLPSK